MAHDFFYDHPAGAEEAKTGATLKPEDSEQKHDFFAESDEKPEKATPIVEAKETKEIGEKESKPAAPRPTRRELSALFENQEYKMPADSKFKHKVNGEDIEVSLQELLNNYSGKQGWDKKFSELDKERQAYKKDLDVVNKYLNEFADKSKTDPIAAFEYLAEVAGTDALEFRKNLRSQFVSKYGDLLKMDEPARQTMELKEENEYFRKKHETELKRRADEQARVELESKLKQAQQTNGISDDRLNELISDLKQYGGMEKPSLNDVIALNAAYVRQDRAMDVLGKVSPELLKDDNKLAIVESLISGNSSLSDKDLYEYVSKLWGNDVSKAVASLNNKTAKKGPEIKKVQNFKSKLLATNNVDFFND